MGTVIMMMIMTMIHLIQQRGRDEEGEELCVMFLTTTTTVAVTSLQQQQFNQEGVLCCSVPKIHPDARHSFKQWEKGISYTELDIDDGDTNTKTGDKIIHCVTTQFKWILSL
mmetsp:Transcript_14989/g.14887  ORF Transcript_14989/g.14887 Transcript_14989/m.14887 type:complete len:112 (+) Transcript_14989:291-626(+)